jgi:hypothetical protein
MANDTLTIIDNRTARANCSDHFNDRPRFELISFSQTRAMFFVGPMAIPNIGGTTSSVLDGAQSL